MVSFRRKFSFCMILYLYYNFFSMFYFDPGIILGLFRHGKSFCCDRKIESAYNFAFFFDFGIDFLIEQ